MVGAAAALALADDPALSAAVPATVPCVAPCVAALVVARFVARRMAVRAITTKTTRQGRGLHGPAVLLRFRKKALPLNH